MMAMQPVLRLDELWSGDLRSVRVGECRVLLARIDDMVVAYEDRCPHMGLPMSRGTIEGAVITCSGHQWCYDLRDGRGINPRTARLRALPVRVQDGTVWVDPAREPAAALADRPRTPHHECTGQ